MIGKILTL